MQPTTFRAWRHERKFSQEAAARSLGVTLRTVQYWEAGEVPIPESAQILMQAIAQTGMVFTAFEAAKHQTRAR